MTHTSVSDVHPSDRAPEKFLRPLKFAVVDPRIPLRPGSSAFAKLTTTKRIVRSVGEGPSIMFRNYRQYGVE